MLYTNIFSQPIDESYNRKSSTNNLALVQDYERTEDEYPFEELQDQILKFIPLSRKSSKAPQLTAEELNAEFTSCTPSERQSLNSRIEFFRKISDDKFGLKKKEKKPIFSSNLTDSWRFALTSLKMKVNFQMNNRKENEKNSKLLTLVGNSSDNVNKRIKRLNEEFLENQKTRSQSVSPNKAKSNNKS